MPRCYRRVRVADLLAGLIIMMLPVVFVSWAVSELGWWSLGLASVLALPWAITIAVHRSRHMPGHTGDARCPICQRHHRARYDRLRRAEAERAIQTHYEWLVTQEAARRGV